MQQKVPLFMTGCGKKSEILKWDNVAAYVQTAGGTVLSRVFKV